MQLSTLWATCAACAFLPTLAAQNVAPGLRMLGPSSTTTTYMVDNTGAVVHTWPGSFLPGNGMYLESDGTLVRTTRINGGPNIGGRGGGVQRRAFDGTLLWDYRVANANQWQHHDAALLPNGNVLLIVWDRLTATDAIDAGRNPATLTSADWLPDGIIEVQQTGPTTGNVVWAWHFMDHVIQDFDSTKANFGVVADHPELLDINFPGDVLTNGEWNHCNSIAYDAVRDLILLNSPFQDEFYLIDHSTTTAEAAGHTGGNFGKGGDILYRWGNPAAYRAGTATDQQLFFQHGSYIIPPGLPGAGNVLIFNNRAGTPVGQDYSTIVEVQLPASFALAPGAAWGPSGFVWQYQEPTPTNLYSSGLSNAERLPNGNTLVCSGRQSWLFELDPAGNRVWEFDTTTLAPGIVFQVSYVSQLDGLEVARDSNPPNPGTLLPGQTTGPLLGQIWDPMVQPFLSGNLFDLLMISGPSAFAVPAPPPITGTVLIDLGNVLNSTFVLAGQTFQVPLPNLPAFVGTELASQAASLSATEIQLTNALDVRLGF